MITRYLTKTTLSLAGSTLLAFTQGAFASTVNLGTLTPFTGGDVGEGLDLSGNIIYAFNLGPGSTQTVQGVDFVAAPIGAPPTGLTTSAPTHFDYSTANPGGVNGVNYGATANDAALSTIVNTVLYHSNFTLDLAVTPGTQYQLQLILQEAFFPLQITAGRNFDISVDGGLAVDDLALGVETNGANEAGADQGLVYTYNFTATGSSFQVALDDNPLETGDGNAVLAGVVLTEQIPEPSTIVLFGLGFLGSILRRRR
jgi:hypothetical protein